jgi:hypothetical protein
MPKFAVQAVNNAPVDGTNATYSAAVTGLVGLAGDILIINPGANITQGYGSVPQRVIRVTRISFSGIATAAADMDLTIVYRSTADTAGTPATAVPHDPRDGPATAIVQSYTAAPTPGTAVGTIRSEKIFIQAAASQPYTQSWDFGNGPKKCPCLFLPTQGLAVNISATQAGALYDLDIEWTEEPFN